MNQLTNSDNNHWAGTLDALIGAHKNASPRRTGQAINREAAIRNGKRGLLRLLRYRRLITDRIPAIAWTPVVEAEIAVNINTCQNGK